MITDQEREILGYFDRHLVPILLTFRTGTGVQRKVYTAFVLSVNKTWFLITAGHCLKDIERATTEGGYEIIECMLLDQFGAEAKHDLGIPFVYDKSRMLCIYDELNFDYGVILLSLYYQELLEKNGIQPLSEDVWKQQPPQVDFYALLGVPEELIRVIEGGLHIETTLHPIKHLQERPAEFKETDVPRFYGTVALDEELTSIVGMSGGPIFGFHLNEQGELRYWLVALQSSWWKSTRNITACYMKFLGHYLDELESGSSED